MATCENNNQMNNEADSKQNALGKVTIKEWLPPRGVLWTMRSGAMLALILSGFLFFTHIAAQWQMAGAKVPFCSGLSWVDCESVLGSRYAMWLSIPVSGLAMVLYMVVTVLLLAITEKRKESEAKIIWWVLCAAGGAIIASTVWFVYVQFGILGRICSYCLITHAVGAGVGLLILVQGGRFCGAVRKGAVLVGLAGTAVLVMGQVLYVPKYSEEVTWNEGENRWIDGGLMNEENGKKYVSDEINGDWNVDKDENGDWKGNLKGDSNWEGGVRMLGGKVILNSATHPMIGFDSAKHFFVEVTDFTCKRCRIFSDVLEDARPELGADIGVLVVFYPLSAKCNEMIMKEVKPIVEGENNERNGKKEGKTKSEEESEEEEKNGDMACELVRLGIAVWLADKSAYGGYHRWLFENQDEMSIDKARNRAAKLVGRRALEQSLDDKRIEEILRRDVRLAKMLGVNRLPGIVAGSERFTGFPEDGKLLAEILREATMNNK